MSVYKCVQETHFYCIISVYCTSWSNGNIVCVSVSPLPILDSKQSDALHLMSHLTAWCHQPHVYRLANCRLHQPRQAIGEILNLESNASVHAFSICPQIHRPIISMLPWQTHSHDCCHQSIQSKTELLFFLFFRSAGKWLHAWLHFFLPHLLSSTIS